MLDNAMGATRGFGEVLGRRPYPWPSTLTRRCWTTEIVEPGTNRTERTMPPRTRAGRLSRLRSGLRRLAGSRGRGLGVRLARLGRARARGSGARRRLIRLVAGGRRRRRRGLRRQRVPALLDLAQARDVLLMLVEVVGERVTPGAVGDEIEFLGPGRIGGGFERRAPRIGDRTR